MSKPIPIAVAALVEGGRVLLAHRHPLRANYPDCWDLPGGHVEPGETPRDAVRRECREELAVGIIDASPVPMTVSDAAIEKHAFVVTRWHGEPTNAAPDEHDELRWFAADELPLLTISDPAALPDLLNAIRVAADSVLDR